VGRLGSWRSVRLPSMAGTAGRQAGGAAAATLFRCLPGAHCVPRVPCRAPSRAVACRVLAGVHTARHRGALGCARLAALACVTPEACRTACEQAREPRVGQTRCGIDAEPGCVRLGDLQRGQGAELPPASGHLRRCVGDDHEGPPAGV